MKKVNRLISLFLSVMIAAAALPANIGVYAAETEPAADVNASVNSEFEYKLAKDNITLCITKYVGENQNVVIPEEIDGKKVTVISDSTFKNNDIIKEVYIPETISKVEITATRTSSISAFGGDDALPAQGDVIDRPDYVRCEVTGANPFIDCKNLERVEVAPENEYFSSRDGILFTKVEYCQSIFFEDKHYDQLVLLYYPNAKQDSQYVVPDDVRYIGSRLDWLDRHNICEPTNAFGSCPNLKDIFIYDNVIGIAAKEFNANNITIYGYEDTEAMLFANHYGIPFVKLNRPDTESDTDILENPDFELELTLDNEMMIKKYKGTDTVVKIPEWINGIPVVAISNRAFMGSNVKEVYLPKFFETTEFLNTSYDSIDTDMDEFFDDNFSFSDKYNKVSKSKVSRGGFIVTEITLSSPGASPFADCPDLEYIGVDPENKRFKSIDGVLFTKALYARYNTDDESLLALIQYPQAKRCEDYYLPENVVYIGSDLTDLSLINDPHREFAIFDCPYLKNVYLTNDILFIRNGEFGECPELVIHAEEDSYPLYYAEQHDLNYSINELCDAVYGDVTGNGRITAADTLYIMRYLVGFSDFSERQLILADVDGNNKVTTFDAFLVQRYALGFDVGYDVGKRHN